MFIADPASRSRAMAARYITEFVSRYRARDTVLFYEIGNQMNLLEDLDLGPSCKRRFNASSPVCRPVGNFSTDALIKFSSDIVTLIKHLDPTRGVSSGFNTPRASAAHLAMRPEFADGPDWTPDSPAEFTDLLLRTNVPFDIVSLHIYPGGDNLRKLGPAYHETDLADIVARLFHPLGRKVFAGDFGADQRSGLFGDVTRAVTQGVVDFAAIWVWEYYQSRTRQPLTPEGYDFLIEPGHANQIILSDLQPAMGRLPRVPQRPRVVLTWPLPCSSVDRPVDLAAAASFGVRTPLYVEFFVDGRSCVIVSAPFQMRFDRTRLGRRVAAVEARARGPNDTVASFVANVRLNGTKADCNIEQ